MQTTTYGMSVRLPLSYEQAVAAVTAALKDEGFGVLTTIDVRKTLKDKLGAEFQSYTILGTCNPALAYTALQSDIEMGLLLPCNVTVREEEGGSVVSIMDPRVMAWLSDAPALVEVSDVARRKLERVLAALSATAA